MPDQNDSSQRYIIGRERALMTALAKRLHREAGHHHSTTVLGERERGSWFEVQVFVDGKSTGHVARVTIELDRFDASLADHAR